MEQQHANSSATSKRQSKKKGPAYCMIRKGTAVLTGVIAFIIAGMTVIANLGTLPRMLLGAISIYLFWFAIDYYHAKCPKCREKFYLAGEKELFGCQRCGWPE